MFAIYCEISHQFISNLWQLTTTLSLSVVQLALPVRSMCQVWAAALCCPVRKVHTAVIIIRDKTESVLRHHQENLRIYSPCVLEVLWISCYLPLFVAEVQYSVANYSFSNCCAGHPANFQLIKIQVIIHSPWTISLSLSLSLQALRPILSSPQMVSLYNTIVLPLLITAVAYNNNNNNKDLY